MTILQRLKRLLHIHRWNEYRVWNEERTAFFVRGCCRCGKSYRVVANGTDCPDLILERP